MTNTRAKDGIRQKAEAYYIENFESTQAEIAELFSTRQATVSQWISKYNWEEKRFSFHASPTKIKQLLQKELANLTSGAEPKLPTTAISKLMEVLEKCDKKADPVVIHKILKELDYFISEIDPDFASQCTNYHKQFLQYKISLHR